VHEQQVAVVLVFPLHLLSFLPGHGLPSLTHELIALQAFVGVAVGAFVGLLVGGVGAFVGVAVGAFVGLLVVAVGVGAFVGRVVD